MHRRNLNVGRLYYIYIYDIRDLIILRSKIDVKAGLSSAEAGSNGFDRSINQLA